MPEEKKMVPIDTSGPDATIDIEETKDESVIDTEAPKQETETETGIDKTFENERETNQDEQPVQLSQAHNVNIPRRDDPINPDPRAEAWAAKNSRFGRDRAMTYTAFEIHKDLTEKEGYDPSSDEYYAEVDKRIKVDFPHKFGNTNTNTTAPVQTVASAQRSVKPGRKTVRLTSSQVAIAKKLGVPLEDYAKQLKITEGA